SPSTCYTHWLQPPRAPSPPCPPLFLFTAPPPTEIYTLSLHDALPISTCRNRQRCRCRPRAPAWPAPSAGPTRRSPSSAHEDRPRSEEHTSELQSRFDLVCRLLLEKKKQT